MRLIIDRFEGIYAVCEKEDKTMIDIPRSELPDEAEEGHVLQAYNGRITIDKNETVSRNKKIGEMTKGLWE